MVRCKLQGKFPFIGPKGCKMKKGDNRSPSGASRKSHASTGGTHAKSTPAASTAAAAAASVSAPAPRRITPMESFDPVPPGNLPIINPSLMPAQQKYALKLIRMEQKIKGQKTARKYYARG